MSKRTDAAIRRAVMRGWDAKSNSPSESIDNICDAVTALVRREKAKAWDETVDWQLNHNLILSHHIEEPKRANPYRGRAKR